MIILSLDIGIVNNGYTMFDLNKNHVLINDTLITKYKTIEEKIINIYYHFSNMVHNYKPEIIIYEKPVFINRGNNSAFINNVLGIYMLIAELNKINLFSYTAKEVKKVVTQDGNADKNKVAQCVAKLLNISSFKDDHASDSAAVLLTYLIKNQLI